MKLFFALAILFASQAVFAQDACYITEKNVSTDLFFTEPEWTMALEQWNAQEPADPGLLQLFFAWKVYNDELPTANTLKGDKRKHCYIGCRIAQDVAFDTSVYVAWHKEKQDLTDCEKGTFFEQRDYETTVHGAELSKQSSDPQFCLDECNMIKRY